MLTRTYWINEQIGIMPRPAGNEYLESEVKHWKELNVTILVSLLTKEEIQELGLQMEGTFCEQHGINFVSFPITDRKTPESFLKTKALVTQLLEKIDRKEKVLLHCRGGIGRVTLIAGSILITQGTKTNDALEKISKIRTLKVPDTEEQIKWLREFEERIG